MDRINVKTEKCSFMDKMTNVGIFFFSPFSEIARVRASLFQINGVRKEPLTLPEPDGETVTLNEKVYVPVKEHPDVSSTYLFVIMMSAIIRRPCRKKRKIEIQKMSLSLKIKKN
jgi:hypothetical protein